MIRKHTVATLDLYCGLVEEIKIRVKSIQDVITGGISPPFPGLIAQEHCYVQLRMVCELVAIGCIVVHNQTSEVSAFERLWNAKDIMDRLAKLNPYCFPIAVNIVRHPIGSPFAFDIYPATPAPLTKDHFLKLYGRCGDRLHRGHLRKITSSIPAEPVSWVDVGDTLNKIIGLLKAHQISSADYRNHYTCAMENTPGGQCAMITSVSSPDAPPLPPGYAPPGNGGPERGSQP
jgi:hypothetical protein